MDEHFYVVTFLSELGISKQIRIADANSALELSDLEQPAADMIEANIFDRVKVGRLTGVKSLTLEKVTHTVFDLVTD